MEERKDIKERILKALSREDKTIPQLCKIAGLDDELEVISIIGDLETQGKVCLKGWATFVENDDGEPRPGYLAKYGLVPHTMN